MISATSVRHRRPAGAAQGGDVDWSVALRAVQDNPALLATIVEAALEEVPRLMPSIEAGRGRWKRDGELRLAAHTLKGSLRCFGGRAGCRAGATPGTNGHERRFPRRGRSPAECSLRQVQEVVRCLSEYLQSTHEFS